MIQFNSAFVRCQRFFGKIKMLIVVRIKTYTLFFNFNALLSFSSVFPLWRVFVAPSEWFNSIRSSTLHLFDMFSQCVQRVNMSMLLLPALIPLKLVTSQAPASPSTISSILEPSACNTNAVISMLGLVARFSLAVTIDGRWANRMARFISRRDNWHDLISRIIMGCGGPGNGALCLNL